MGCGGSNASTPKAATQERTLFGAPAEKQGQPISLKNKEESTAKLNAMSPETREKNMFAAQAASAETLKVPAQEIAAPLTRAPEALQQLERDGSGAIEKTNQSHDIDIADLETISIQSERSDSLSLVNVDECSDLSSKPRRLSTAAHRALERHEECCFFPWCATRTGSVVVQVEEVEEVPPQEIGASLARAAKRNQQLERDDSSAIIKANRSHDLDIADMESLTFQSERSESLSLMGVSEWSDLSSKPRRLSTAAQRALQRHEDCSYLSWCHF